MVAAMAPAWAAGAAPGALGYDEPLGAPVYDLVASDLLVRPDALVVDMTMRCETVECLHKAAEALASRLREVAGKGELLLREFVPARDLPAKANRWDPAAWQVDASFEVPLVEAQDFWARARLLVAMHRVLAELGRATPQGDKPGAVVTFNAPRPVVRDVERYREQLLGRWVQRARQLAAQAQSSRAPLVLRDCLPPAAVEQRLISLEQVALTLQFSCRLDLAGER